MVNPAFTLDPATLQQMIEQAINEKIIIAVEDLCQDPTWLEKIEKMFNQAAVQRTVSALGQIDFTPMVKDQVDLNMKNFQQDILTKFSSTGIDDRATKCQLTVMDDETVVENQLITKELDVIGTAVVNDLAVKGTININNRSWQNLSDTISNKTLEKINQDWKQQLVTEVKNSITKDGINFDQVTVKNEPLFTGNALNSSITDTKIQKLGILKELSVQGPASVYDTLNVVNKRVGVNTQTPEMAFAVWDEEISITVGKFKNQQGWIGTNRNQALTLGVNRTPQIEMDADGLTTIKQLRIGQYKISHATQVPGWSGTRGDMVLNSNFGPDRVFAWMCLGGHKWQTLKSAE
jgi:hypothetical protein